MPQATLKVSNTTHSLKKECKWNKNKLFSSEVELFTYSNCGQVHSSVNVGQSIIHTDSSLKVEFGLGGNQIYRC